MTDDELDAMEREAYQALEDIKRIAKEAGTDYLEMLEDYYVCAVMNWESCLQEVEELRREVQANTHG